MFFSVITKNLNWKILTKNLFTFKRWDEVKHEKRKILILWEFTEKFYFQGGGSRKTNILGGSCLKREGLAKKRWGVGVDTSMQCTICLLCSRHIVCIGVSPPLLRNTTPFFLLSLPLKFANLFRQSLLNIGFS